jgi:hypothetical protein
MHVDGGVEAQVMLYENALLPFSTAERSGGRVDRTRKLYVIRNEKIYPEWQDVKPSLKYIALRSIDTLIKSQGLGDLYRLYAYTVRDKMEYNIIFIPATFSAKEESLFDNAYMRKVFALGYDLGSKGNAWSHYPPGYEPS